jgi:tetratricopeptide (TPR) repeat protein
MGPGENGMRERREILRCHVEPGHGAGVMKEVAAQVRRPFVGHGADASAEPVDVAGVADQPHPGDQPLLLAVLLRLLQVEIVLAELAKPRARVKHEEAMAQFRRTLELDPGYAKAHDLLGFVHLEEKELDEAVSAFERTVALSPHTPKYVAALVKALAKAGRRSDAEKALDELRALSKTRHIQPELIASLAETIETM